MLSAVTNTPREPRCDVFSSGINESALPSRYVDSRIDIYKFREDKQVAGWRPFKETGDSGTDLDRVVLVDQEYCLTVNSRNVAYMWKLPSCEAVWRMEGGSNWCLSPGGKYLGFKTGTHDVFLDPRTGDVVGTDSPYTFVITTAMDNSEGNIQLDMDSPDGTGTRQATK